MKANRIPLGPWWLPWLDWWRGMCLEFPTRGSVPGYIYLSPLMAGCRSVAQCFRGITKGLIFSFMLKGKSLVFHILHFIISITVQEIRVPVQEICILHYWFDLWIVIFMHFLVLVILRKVTTTKRLHHCLRYICHFSYYSLPASLFIHVDCRDTPWSTWMAYAT